jgi:hypothetical protein
VPLAVQLAAVLVRPPSPAELLALRPLSPPGLLLELPPSRLELLPLSPPALVRRARAPPAVLPPGSDP